MDRRQALKFLGQAAATVAIVPKLRAEELKDVPLQTEMSADHLPKPAHVGGYQVLTNEIDRKNLAAVYDRLIPGDDLSPSASDCGCLEFIDDQLAGDYGDGKALYLKGPIDRENEERIMGQPQFLATPKQRYLSGLKAIEDYSQKQYNKSFFELTEQQVDDFLVGLEAGKITLGNDVNGQAFFELMLQNVKEGFLADPLYGGNKNMAGWKMIGFPGARYDYRAYLPRRGEKLALIPVSLIPND